jgi:hypothetical protein
LNRPGKPPKPPSRKKTAGRPSLGERTPRGRASSIPSHAHACRRTRTHAQTYTHIRTHKYTMHARTYVHNRKHTHVHNARSHVRTRTHTHTNTHIRTHARTRMRAHMRTHAHVRTHMRVHTHVGAAHWAGRPSHRLTSCLLIMWALALIALGFINWSFSNLGLVTVQYGIRCIYTVYNFGREVTNYTVTYSIYIYIYIRFWPTLFIINQQSKGHLSSCFSCHPICLHS